MLGVEYSLFFKLAAQLLKYFCLLMLGAAIALILSGLFGGKDIAWDIIQTTKPWISRTTIIVIWILAGAIIFESIRN